MGPLLDEPFTKQLDGKLRELRFYLGGRPTRITYWIASNRIIDAEGARPQGAGRCPGRRLSQKSARPGPTERRLVGSLLAALAGAISQGNIS
jgi:hypothetical protein